METCIALFISLVVLLFLNLLFSKTNVHFYGSKAHPFGLFVIIQFIIISLPGVLMISFLGYESDRYLGISSDTKFAIGIWYFYSFIVLFFILYLLVRIGKLNWYSKCAGEAIPYEKYIKYFFVFITISILFIAVKFVLSKPAPIYYLILGDVNKAYETRVDMQLHPEDYYIPYFSRFITMFLVYQFYFCYYFYTFSTKRTVMMRMLIIVSFCMAVLEVLYDTQKAPLIFIVVGALFINQLKKQNIGKLLIAGIILGITVTILQSFVTGADISESLTRAVDRFVLGQNQGFYHIINSIKPDEKYWFTGFFFVEQFGIIPSRADMDVIPYTIYAGSDIVNVNSYYMGEAWSMFGVMGLLFSPVIVAFMIYFYIKIIDLYIGVEPIFTVPFMIYFVPEIRVQQSFTYFLYSKTFLLSFILFIVIVIVVKTLVGVLKPIKVNNP